MSEHNHPLVQVPRTQYQHDFATDIMIWDRNNPRSVVNLVDEKAGMHLENSRKEKPHFFDLDETELTKVLDAMDFTPSPTDNRLRIKFWMEYDFTQTQQTSNIDLRRVAAGTCELDFLRLKYFKRPERVAWLLCPPHDYMTRVNEALQLSITQMRKILAVPVEKNGKVDTRLGELQAKIHVMLESRIHGTPVQRNLSIQSFIPGHQAAKAIGAETTEDTAEELAKRLNKAKEMADTNLNGGVVAVEKDSR